MRRIATSFLIGVSIQFLVFACMALGVSLLSDESSASEIAALLSTIVMPGFLILWPQGTGDNPHPQFSTERFLSAIAIDVAAYSLVAYAVLMLFSHFRSKRRVHDAF